MTGADREGRPGTTPHVRYVTEDRSISDAVVDAVAAVSGREPVLDATANGGNGGEPLDPLYGVVDPDALDAIVRSRDGNGRPVVVTFTYCGYEVTVESTGQITITAN